MNKLPLLFVLVFICSSVNYVDYAHARKKHHHAAKKKNSVQMQKKARQISDSGMSANINYTELNTSAARYAHGSQDLSSATHLPKPVIFY